MHIVSLKKLTEVIVTEKTKVVIHIALQKQSWSGHYWSGMEKQP